MLDLTLWYEADLLAPASFDSVALPGCDTVGQEPNRLTKRAFQQTDFNRCSRLLSTEAL